MNENNELAKRWFERAISNLERAKLLPASQKIFYEDFCFDCQQAVEKSLKALLIFHNIEFPKTHALNILIKLLKSSEQYAPEFLEDAIFLADYSVETRYPGDYEPVNKDEYIEALSIAEKIVAWVDSRINDKTLF